MNSHKQKSCDIFKLTMSNNVLTKPSDINNELSSYFSTIGETLINKLASNHALNMTDFQIFCDKPLKNEGNFLYSIEFRVWKIEYLVREAD